MSKKLAPRGEGDVPELRKVLARVAETADEAAGFVLRYLEIWGSSSRGEMETNLWYGESHFAELIEAFHCAMIDLNAVADKNPEAQYLVSKIPLISRWDTDIGYIKRVLEISSGEASEWLAAHPVEKMSLLDWVIDHLTSRPPGVLLATAVIVAGYIHYGWWVFRGRKRVEENGND